MRHWLMKSEPSEISIDDLSAFPNQTVAWFGVRNYLARNFMRDHMQLNDAVLFYHSSCPEPGVAGIARVSALAYPDATQFDIKSKYFDAKATIETPRWFNVDVQFIEKTVLIGLPQMRENPKLASMQILQKGNRLSITPVTPAEYKAVLAMQK